MSDERQLPPSSKGEVIKPPMQEREKDFKFPSPKPPRSISDEDDGQEKEKKAAEKPAVSRREWSREAKESAKEEEYTLQGQFLDLVAKSTALTQTEKNQYLELFTKGFTKEAHRRFELELSQRQYMWFMMADKERDMGHIGNLVNAFIGLADKYGEVKQATPESKAEAVMNVLGKVFELPPIAMFMGMATEWFQERAAKKARLKDPMKERRRRQLQKELDALIESENPQDTDNSEE